MNANSESFSNSPEACHLASFQSKMLRQAQRATRDGGFELGWGVAILMFGLGSYLTPVLPKSLWMSAWTAWIGYVPLFCAAFAPFAIPKLVQRLISAPRAGYIANPNDPKLGDLVMIMIFGSALGFTISLPMVLVSEVRQVMSHSGPPSDIHSIVVHSIKLLVCAALTVYLGPKVIKKPKLSPVAYEASVITHELKQTASGRKHLRLVKFTLMAMFIGLLILLSAIVIGLMFWGGSVLPYSEIHPSQEGVPGVIRHPGNDWSQLGMAGFLVATNALLYLMASGVALKPHRWKWLLVPVMLIAPILIAPSFPRPKPQLTQTFDSLPPVMLCLGAVWFLSGAISLMLFMRHNPAPSAATP